MTDLADAQARRTRDRSAVLLDVGRILTGTLRSDELYRAIHEQASRVLDATGLYIALYDEPSDTATVVYHVHDGRETDVQLAFRGSENPAVRARHAVRVDVDGPGFATLRLALGDTILGGQAMCAPILADGRVKGIIGIYTLDPVGYDERDVELLHAIGALAGVALGSAEYIRETDERRREAERLEEISRDLSSSLELGQVLHRVVEGAVALTEADGAAVLLREGRGEDLLIAAIDHENGFRVGQRIELPPALHERLVEHRRSLIIQNLAGDPILPPAPRGDDRVETSTAVAVPLIAGDAFVGILTVGHHGTAPRAAREVALVERLGVNVAIALENARLHEQIRTLSLTDPLTGLPNRRHMERVLEKEFAAARRGRRLAVVLFDLDNFKRYNDTAGHQAGDEVLRSFARVLAGETRTFDVAARYGGDEFLCILSDPHEGGAEAHAARVRRAVDEHPLLSGMGVSAGYAYFVPSMPDPATLIGTADERLYADKLRRRDR